MQVWSIVQSQSLADRPGFDLKDRQGVVILNARTAMVNDFEILNPPPGQESKLHVSP